MSAVDQEQNERERERDEPTLAEQFIEEADVFEKSWRYWYFWAGFFLGIFVGLVIAWWK